MTTRIDPKACCYYQGVNEYGEDLPERAEFKPFFPFTYRVPVVTAAQFAEVLAWCAAALGEKEDGRWLEDFEYWHLGDEMAAMAFKAAWIDPISKPSWGTPQVSEASPSKS